jgi:hypothetical protein
LQLSEAQRKSKTFLKSRVLVRIQSEGPWLLGGIGIHVGLRNQCRKDWGFDSLRGYQMNKREKEKMRADEKRAALAAYKIEKGCVDCGYNDNADALEFDHLHGKQGKTVASMMYNSWSVIWAEVDKCEVRCANCHAIITQQRKRH